MKEVTQKWCVNAGCSLKEIKIRTDAEVCISCGKTLSSWNFDDLIDPFGGLFSKKRPKA